MSLTKFICAKDYEKISYVVRRHYVTLVPALIEMVFFLALPFGMYWLISMEFPKLLIGQAAIIMILLASMYYLALISFCYTFFITYYLNVLIVTNDRLMDINQQGLFARTISELDLYKIQDITSEIKGVFQSTFGYGKLYIQTAGAIEKFIIEDVPDPERLRQAILTLAEQDRKYHLSLNANTLEMTK